MISVPPFSNSGRSLKSPGFSRGEPLSWNTTMPSLPPVPPPAAENLTSSDFPVLWPVGTRWADNDMFGHLNNAVYYLLFDTAINAWINTSTGLDPMTIPALGIVAESGCRYFSELHFPE